MPKTVIITGASSGIGRAAAAEFARHGWRVGLIARGEDTLDAARRDVIEAGGTASLAQADVADSAALEAAAAHIEAELGPVDVWINNAGVGIHGFFLDIPEDEFRRLTEVNYFGTVNGTRVALSRMMPRDHGTIIQIASAISYRGVPLQSPYSGSKYAIRGFTEALRSELANQNSRVHLTLVHPPAVNTPFYNHATSHMPRPLRPPPPVYQPPMVARGIYRAATTRRRDHKLGVVTKLFAAGNTLAPGVLDYAAGKAGVMAQQSLQGGRVALRDPNLRTAGRTGPIAGPFKSGSLSILALSLGLIALARLSSPSPSGRGPG